MGIFDIKINDDGLIKISDFYVGMPCSEMRQLLYQKKVDTKESPSIEPDHTTITICEFFSFELYDTFFVQLETYKNEIVTAVALGAAPSSLHQHNMAKSDLIYLFDDIVRKTDLKAIDAQLQKLLHIEGEYLSNDKYAVSMQLEGDFLFLTTFYVAHEDEDKKVKAKIGCVFSIYKILYLVGIYLVPFLTVAALVTDGWTKYSLCSVVLISSPIVFLTQINHMKLWLEAHKHHVQLCRMSFFGLNILIAISFLLNIPSYIYCLCWRISTDKGFVELFMDISPIFIWVFLAIWLWKIKKY